MIRYTIPFSTEKNLAEAYNLEMELAPHGSYVCFTDRDIWFPHPNFGHQVERIVSQHGEAVYTCLTNRVNCPWQRVPFKGNGQDAERFARKLYAENVNTVEDHTDSQLMSGFMVIFPKDKWLNLPEDKGLLGVDNMIHNMAKVMGLRVLLMKGVFCWHYYSGFDGEGGNKKRDKSHLQ